MRPDKHPVYRDVVYQDSGTGFKFLTRSTVHTSETIEHNGKEYPLFKIEISSDSHPFYTGNARLLDAEGRIERFNRRYNKGK